MCVCSCPHWVPTTILFFCFSSHRNSIIPFGGGPSEREYVITLGVFFRSFFSVFPYLFFYVCYYFYRHFYNFSKQSYLICLFVCLLLLLGICCLILFRYLHNKQANKLWRAGGQASKHCCFHSMAVVAIQKTNAKRKYERKLNNPMRLKRHGWMNGGMAGWLAGCVDSWNVNE